MLKVYLSKILLFVLLTILTTTAFSRKFYFSSSTGNDSYSITQAQNPATPWKTLMKLQSLITNGNSTFLPGDTLAFKRGDTFANGYSSTSNPSYFTYVSCAWNNIPAEGYTAPSGTQANPIVLTNYGTGELPNFYYPDATIPTVGGSYAHNVFEFAGVSWIVIDGLQFNDTRFSATNKEAPSFTRSAILFGTWENSKLASNGTDTVWGSNRDTTNRKRLVRNCTVKNCNFNNISFAFGSIAGINCKISNNNITNLKSCTDTSGTYDVGAGAFEGVYGYYNEISHNYVKGAWGKSGRVSSTFGLFGVGVDIFCLKYSKINYNTFIDCSGAWEIGNLDRYDVNSGAWYDTFAYNKVINCGQLGYIHGGATNNDPFAGNNRNIACFNNVVINNNTSRMAGPKFGSDIYNDGQSFANWWFFRSPTKCVDNSLPVSNTTWSNPINPPYCNYGGHRFTVQYSTDVIKGNADTLVDLRNNIFYATTGDQIIYDASRTKFKHRNNIYYIKGGFLNPTALGGTAGVGEIVTTNQIFIDTSAAFPEDWDLHLPPNSPAISAGVSLGFNSDFEGVAISGNPEIGLFEYNSNVTPNPPPPVNFVASSTQGTISCNGGNTTITVSASGGTSPYTGTGTFTVSAGNYNYYVSDAVGKRDTVSVVINQPSIISVTLASGTITTAGGTTSIQINATGGTGTSYQYSLNGGAYQSSNLFTGVPAGNHIVNVKDINGCVVQKSLTITGPSVTTLTASSTSGTILCNGGTTIVTVSASGGVTPYTGTGSFTVTAGIRTYTVTDAAGTTATNTINVSQPSLINVTINAGTISFFGGSTTITVIANGGTGILNYKLDNGAFQTSNIFNNVLAGTHTIIVKDLNSCTKTSTVTINQPASIPLNATAIAGSILCNGSSTSVTVSATGGTAPYTGTGTFSVFAGTHAYTVTDANGNTSIANIIVTEPQLINVNPISGNITSNGGSTSITVNATGGVSPFTYKLNNGNYQSSNIFSGVFAGTHVISVKDVNGCTSLKNVNITQPSNNPIIVTAIPAQINCFGSSTIVTVSASGGTAPYTGTGIFSATAGTRSYTVRDAVGNSKTTTITIIQPTEINLIVSVASDISVIGGTTSVSAVATGGTGSYRFSLDAGQTQTSNSFRAVGAGTHFITSVDANGCSKMTTFTVNQVSSNGMTLNLLSKTDATCKGGKDGSIEVKASGGREPYQYAIGAGNYQINNRFYGLRAGSYRVFVKDANNNIVNIVVVILDGKRPCRFGKTEVIINTYPNPTTTSFKLSIDATSDEEVYVEVMDLFGRKLFQERGGADKIYNFGQNFKAGSYFVRVNQGEVQTTQKIIKQ